MAYQVKKANLPLIYDFGLLGQNMVIGAKKLKLKIFHRNFRLSRKKVFKKVPVQKSGWTDLGSVPEYNLF